MNAGGRLTRRRFFGTAAAFAAVAGCRSGGGADEVRLRVGVCSDVHLLTANDTRWQGGEVFEKTLRVYNEKKADAVLLCGDIADCGLTDELAYAADIWNRVFPDGRRSDGAPVERLFLLGDHDLGGFAQRYPWARKRSRDPDAVNHPLVTADLPAVWRRLFDEDWTPVQVKTVKGYRFVLAHFPLNGGEGTGDVPLPGLDAALAAADDDPSRPLFYAQHRPVYGTLPEANPASLEKSANYRALARHPNVLAFFGHCHRNCADELNLWQGAFMAVHVPSTNYCGTRGGRENSFTVANRPTFDKAGKGRVLQMTRTDVTRTRQCLFLTVHADRLVLSRHDLANDGSMGPDWTIPLPAPDGACAAAARKAKSRAPAFPAGAAAVVTEGRGRDRAKRERDEVVVSFPPAHAAAGRPRAFDYEVTAAADGKTLVRRVFSTRPCWTEAADTEPVRCVFAAAELPADGRIVFTVRPADAFGLTGAPLTAERKAKSDA